MTKKSFLKISKRKIKEQTVYVEPKTVSKVKLLASDFDPDYSRKFHRRSRGTIILLSSEAAKKNLSTRV